jgi:hypothetical protein
VVSVYAGLGVLLYPFFEAFVTEDVAAMCKADGVTTVTVGEVFSADDTLFFWTDFDAFVGVGLDLWRSEDS